MNEGYRLYAQPSFLDGLGRLMDYAGALNKYNTSKSGREADMKAIRSDWVMVGKDLKAAFKHGESKIHDEA